MNEYKYIITAFDPKRQKNLMTSAPRTWIHCEGVYADYLKIYGDFCEIKITPYPYKKETENDQPT